MADVLVEQVTSEVRRLTAQSFDLACAYARGADPRQVAPRAATLDRDLARLQDTLRVMPEAVPAQALLPRCEAARLALGHLLVVPRLRRLAH